MISAHKMLHLHDGALDRHPDGSQNFQAQASDLSLQASFTPQADGTVRVSGLLTKVTGRDRAILLRYTLPMKTEGAVFGCNLDEAQHVGPDTRALVGTIFPVAAMTQGGGCAALAIPPTCPCCFGMTGTEAGLAVEFYLGLAADTKRFPNQARFEFLIYSAQADWPFRSALARYYELAPEFYTPRVRGGGFWNKHEPGNIDAALPFYRFQVLSSRELSAAEMQRRGGFGLLSFYYLLVGNRRIKDLPETPKNYEAAMKVFQDLARHGGQPPKDEKRPETLASTELIARCACQSADGRYILHKMAKGDTGSEGDKDSESAKATKVKKTAKVKRKHDAESKELTFIMNPNPDLFADRGSDTVGGLTIRACQELLAAGPGDGFEFDSLGGRWPAHLNFRRDHFPYARYPLTFDDQGRVAIHNYISHYECIETLRALTRAQNKFLFGNGIYTYERTPGADNYEHHNSQQNGRFFLAALLDVLGRENSGLFERTSLEQMRAMAGSKLFTMVMYQWDDPEFLRVQMNRNLVYAIFGMPSDKHNGYVISPAFARDRQLIEWFVKNCRRLQEAGWQPVTHARASLPDVACERYGSSETVYFTAMNFASEARDCDLVIDLNALAGTLHQGGIPRLQEIARDATISTAINGGECRVRLRLPPNETQIIQVQYSGPTSSDTLR